MDYYYFFFFWGGGGVDKGYVALPHSKFIGEGALPTPMKTTKIPVSLIHQFTLFNDNI